MSQANPTATSSSNFQPIFNNALKEYQRRTKKDLLTHPLAAQLQACDSPSSILVLLRQQVQELDRSQSSDVRLTKWLDPTVNVLYALSDTLGEGVGLVCSRARICKIYIIKRISQMFSPARMIFTGVGVLLLVCLLNTFARTILILTFYRQLKMFVRAKTLSLTFLNT